MDDETAPRLIPLTRGLVTLVDRQDYDQLKSFRWIASGNERDGFYAVCYVGPRSRRAIKMHRVILGAEVRYVVDHRNGDGLDNRRHNLRVCTQAQNVLNRRRVTGASGIKGVRETKFGTWEAQIKVARKRLHLGTFGTALNAALAYDAAALEHFGEFAATNEALGLLPSIDARAA